MSSLSLKNVKIQDPTGTLVSTLSYDGTNITIDKPVLAPTAPAGTSTTQLATTAFAMGAGIGSNQTWQDVKSNRAVGTTYTNSTGRPILVSIIYTNDTANTAAGLVINGATVYASGVDTANYGSGFSLLVPNGATYKTTNNSGTITIVGWMELR